MLLKIITNTLKKVLFTDDKNTQYVPNICCSWIKNWLSLQFYCHDFDQHGPSYMSHISLVFNFVIFMDL